MEWVFRIFVYGCFALLAFILSVVFFRCRKYKLGLTFGCLELLAAIPSARIWMDALKGSGKSDWLSLGIVGYPPVALCFYAMLLAGAVCVALNAWRIWKGAGATRA